MPDARTFRVLDRDYPHQLRELSSPPDPLCIRGELLAGPTIAIVGTRKPSAEALAYAHRLAFRLARSGVTVWSGGAFGIDAAAHRGALDAGGRSVAVIGTGLEHCYPPEHASLYEEIVATGGALVSPFPRSQHATLFTFPQRNGVLAALTQATVVVQAPIKSGARSMAGHARRLRRPLFVVPASPWDKESAGNVAELALGGRPLADDSLLFEFLGVPPPPIERADVPPAKNAAETSSSASSAPNRVAEIAPLPLVPAHRAVFLATSHTPHHLENLCEITGLPAALVHEALLTLTLEAVLVEGPAGWFRRISTGKH